VVIYPTVHHPRSKTIYPQDFQINIVTVDACDQYSSSGSKLHPPDDISSIVSCLNELLCGFHGTVNTSLVGLQFSLKGLVLLLLSLQIAGVLGYGKRGVQIRPSMIHGV